MYFTAEPMKTCFMKSTQFKTLMSTSTSCLYKADSYKAPLTYLTLSNS